MTNTTIFATIALTSILLLGTSYVLAADHGDAPLMANDQGADIADDTAQLFPSWFNNNLQWYLDGQVDEMTLANAFQYLADEEIVFLDPDKATKVRQLEDENEALKKKLDVDGMTGPKTNAGNNVLVGAPGDDTSPTGGEAHLFDDAWGEETEQEALHHLRKAYDLNPNFQTKVVQFDKNHDKWIDVLSIDWGSSSSQDCSAAEGSSDENSSCWVRVSQAHAGEEIWTDEYGRTSSSGDPDRPIIAGDVYNSEGESTTNTQTGNEQVIVFTGLEFASETVHDLVTKGDTSTTGWDEGIAAFKKGNYGTSSTTTSTSIHELGHALGVFCTVAMDKEVQRHETDLEFLKELSDAVQEDSETTTGATGTTARLTTGTTITNIFQELALERAEKLEKKVDSLQVGMDICNAELKNLEDDLQTAGDDAQLANIDLQNMLQKHQQTMQMMSNIMKSQHDTLKAIIQNMRA